jgi:propionyl-CoA carboxylase alpha chain
VFCEPYLAAVRHIEVQVMADQHGTVWAVGERECSIQRRHQKVIEEAPSPLVERLRWMRSGLFDAARKAASAIGYVGAGTVEFLADDNGRFYFLEMNTRLQVEHPVTECTTGLDLVRLQFAIASGRRLEPEPPPTVGHSIEVRLYAEDPAQDWQPQSGTLHRFHVPGVTQEFTSPLSTIGPNPPLVDGGPACAAGTEGRIGTDRQQGWGNLLRVDSGVVDGSSVSAFYDAMLAKVIVWAPTRTDATTKLAAALARAELHGLRTNRDLLVRVLRHPAFQAGDTDTAFLDRNGLDTLAEPLADKDTETLSALAAALADAARRREGAPVQKRLPSGWRNLPSVPQRKTFTAGDASYEVAYRLTRDGLVAAGMETVRLIRMDPHHVVLEVDGVRRAFRVVAYPGLVCVDSPLGAVALTPVERFPDPLQHIVAGSLLAPMPGTVLRVGIAVGDRVVRGQPLIWLEAMKMEHTVSAPADGIVGEVAVAAGQQVELGAVLAVVQEGSDADLGRATQQQTATEEEQ